MPKSRRMVKPRNALLFCWLVLSLASSMVPGAALANGADSVEWPFFPMTYGSIIYEEDFGGETSWEIGGLSGSGSESLIEDGKYVTRITQPGRSLVSFCQCGPFESFSFSVLVHQTAGESERAASFLAVGSQDIYGTGCLIFEMGTHEIRVFSYSDKRIRHEVMRVAIGVDFTQPRRVEAVCAACPFDAEPRCSLRIDGSTVLTLKVELSPGDIGLGAGNLSDEGATFVFDDVVVRSVVCGGPSEREEEEPDADGIGLVDLCDEWPESLSEISASEISVCGVYLAMSREELLAAVKGGTFSTSGPLPQYSSGDITYTLSSRGDFVLGITMDAGALPQELRDALRSWDEAVLKQYFGADSSVHGLSGLFQTLETPRGIKAVKLSGDAVYVILSLSEEEESALEGISSATDNGERKEYSINADGTGDFRSLKEALLQVPDGGILRLGAGTFVCQEPLARTGSIHIIGLGDDVTVVSGSVASFVLGLADDEAAVEIEKIKFIYTGTAPADVVVGAVRSLRITDCSFLGGVAVDEGTSGPRHPFGAGVFVAEGCDFEIIGSEASKNAYGLLLAGTGRVSQVRCSQNISEGILVIGDAVVEDSNCDDNSVGIYFGAGADGAAIRNECDSNSFSGIVIEASDVSIQQNSARANPVGIWIMSASRCDVTGNLCERNTLYGISITDQSAPAIHDNTCNNNEGAGILCAGQSAARLERNTCSSNQYGILYAEEAGGTADRNICRDNEIGIVIYPTARVALGSNTCEGNTEMQIADLRR